MIRTYLPAVISLFLVAALLGCADRTDLVEDSQASQEDSTFSQEDAAEPNIAPPLPEQPVGLLQFQPLQPGDTIAVITTSMGEITLKLFPEVAPMAVENFTGLAKQGYYNGKIFHRVVPDTLAQGGSPKGDGLGGESIFKDSEGKSLPFPDEFSTDLWHFRGAVSMANSGPDTNLSQFFLVKGYSMTDALLADMTAAQLPLQVIEQYQEAGGMPHLDWGHTVFGQIVEGMDVLEEMLQAEIDSTTGQPLETITILMVSIETVDIP